jgi:HEPN domain-containing protein
MQITEEDTQQAIKNAKEIMEFAAPIIKRT